MPQYDDSVTKVTKLRKLNVAHGKPLVQVADVLEQLLAAPDHLGLPAKHHREDPVPLDVGIELLQEGFVVSAVVRVSCPFKRFDVFLRHRMRSISRRTRAAPAHSRVASRPCAYSLSPAASRASLCCW